MQWVVAEPAVGSDGAQCTHAIQSSSPSNFFDNELYVFMYLVQSTTLNPCCEKGAQLSPCQEWDDDQNRTLYRQLIQEHITQEVVHFEE